MVRFQISVNNGGFEDQSRKATLLLVPQKWIYISTKTLLSVEMVELFET